MIESFATNGEHCKLLSCRRLIFYCRVLKISHDNQEDMDLHGDMMGDTTCNQPT